MAHLQYIPGDPRLVDQLVYELKSKGIFDQFRKDCIADVDTRPAYQNLRQRVENSVSTFLSHQCWKPDLNKNQLREKLRKHILDGNYLEQGVERIVDQVVNPKVASVFIPQVEDLVYNYLGITRKKTTAPVAETSNGKSSENDLLPTDLEAVSPGSVNDDKNEPMDVSELGDDTKMEVDQKEISKEETKEDSNSAVLILDKDKAENQDNLSRISELTPNNSNSLDKSTIPLPTDEIKLENIPAPENSPPKATKVKVELEKIQLPDEPNFSTDIPLPEEIQKPEKDNYFKPINSDDDDCSSDAESLRRNMSPLTPIRNFNNENSCDAQQAFDNDTGDNKNDLKDNLEPNTFRFSIENKSANSPDAIKPEKKDTEQADTNLAYQFSNQVNINTFNTPVYDDSSNSNLLHIDYESDISKQNSENKAPEVDQNSEDAKKDKQSDKKSSHKSSHSHRDSHRHSSSSKDRKSDPKQSSSKDSKTEKKSSREEHKSSSSKSGHKGRSSDKSDKKDSRDSSKHRSSHKRSSSSSHRDSKSHKSSSSSQKHSSSSKHAEDKKSSSSSNRDKSVKSMDKSSKEKSSKESKSSSSSHRSDKDRKSSSSSKNKNEDKDKKKDKKETDDHYSASGRNNHTRRSTDRDSNDGSSSSKGSHNPPSAKSSDCKKESKSSTSKSDGTSSSRGSTSPSDKDHLVDNVKTSQASVVPQNKPVIRVENHLEMPIASPPRLPFVPDITLKKPKFAANLQEARKLMKMRKFLDEEQKRMNQEAALLLEFQANVRPSLSQVYSSIPGPELEFACVTTPEPVNVGESAEARNDSISDILNAAEQVENIEVSNTTDDPELNVTHTDTTMDSVTSEADKEASETADKATVQVENVTEPEDNDVKMDIDTSLDGKNVLVLENIAPKDKKDKSPQDTKSKDVDVKTKEPVYTKRNVSIVSEQAEEKDEIEEKLECLLHDDYEKPLEYFEVTVITEELSESEDDENKPVTDEIKEIIKNCPEKDLFKYFAEHEKFLAELERDKFSTFLKSFTENCNKMYLINCNSYEENILKEVSQNFGDFKIVNYHKNGHLKLNSTVKNIVRNVNVSSEISLPLGTSVNTFARIKSPSVICSPVKSDCSFELSSDYDAKLEEMVSKTSRKEIMEIILGSVVDDSATEELSDKMPTIDYCNDSNIESNTENGIKRKFCEVESSENNNRQVLTPNKIRKLSGSDQITSTTGESEESSNNNVVTTLNSSNQIRSKYLGRAKRVGLPRPKRCNLPNSPSSDKSVENYEQNTPQLSTPNGKMKTPRNKVQRYDTSDLYKPKLHYLSRRNNIS